MNALMYLTASGASVWRRQGGQWAPTSVQPGDSLWVVTNLAEETIADLSIPKLSARDRARYVARQLANRFPGSEFALAPSRGRWLRSAGGKQGLAALDPPDRLKSAMADAGARLAGVYCSSLLLAKMAQEATGSAHAIAAAATDAGLRVVALVDGAAVLTRLVQGAVTPDEQAGEILRTVRHLENTRLIERDGSQLDMLLLGTHAETSSLLTADRLRPVAPVRGGPSGWNLAAPGPWFELARRSPELQMAAVSQRLDHLQRVLHRSAWASTAVGGVALLALGWGLWGQGRAERGIQAQFSAQLAPVQAAASALEARLAAQPLPAAVLREMHTQYVQELGQMHGMWADVEKLSRVLATHDELRLSRLQWRRLPLGEAPCGKPAARDAGSLGSLPMQPGAGNPSMQGFPSDAADSSAAPETPSLELSFQLEPSPADLAQQIQRASTLTAQLRQWPGVTVLVSPLAALREGELKGGAQQRGDEQPGLWCLAMRPAIPAQPESAAADGARVGAAGPEPSLPLERGEP
jgi:hypothetical protein